MEQCRPAAESGGGPEGGPESEHTKQTGTEGELQKGVFYDEGGRRKGQINGYSGAKLEQRGVSSASSPSELGGG